MPQTDGTVNRRGPEYQVSEFSNGFGAAPCDACGEFHRPTQTTCGDTRAPVRQYIIGHYGAIAENPEWRRNKELSRHRIYDL
jgi:hypothetical protein